MKKVISAYCVHIRGTDTQAAIELYTNDGRVGIRAMTAEGDEPLRQTFSAQYPDMPAAESRFKRFAKQLKADGDLVYVIGQEFALS